MIAMRRTIRCPIAPHPKAARLPEACHNFRRAIPHVVTMLLLSGCGASTPSQDGANDNTSPAGSGGAFVFEEETADASLAELGFVEDELIVHTLPGADSAALDDAYEAAGASAIAAIPEVNAVVLSVAPEDLNASAAALSANELIESVRKNYLYEQNVVPNDTWTADQSHLEQLGLPQAWDVTTGFSEIIIAILDTGVLPSHEDLKAKLLSGFNTVDNNVNSADVHGHGTAVAGSAAAISNNGKGVAGVCWDCPLLPVRVSLPDGRASSRAIAAAILWAVNHDAKVINISFGPLESDKTVLAAAQSARNHGCLVFIAAGNEAQIKTTADSESALFVGAVDEDNAPAEFTNIGPFVDFTAPGVGIVTTNSSGGYAAYNGTSFSSPIAAGVGALVWSINPAWRPATIESILQGSVVDLGTNGRDTTFGYGLVHASAAVNRALDTNEPADTTAPTLTVSEPVDGAAVAGKIKIVAAATDASGVADVVLSLDGVPYATDSTAPYKLSLDTAPLASGSHTLSVVATDVAGNASAAKTLRISTAAVSADKTAPAATIITPSNGATVIGTVEARALLTDNAALAKVEWLVDNKSVRTQKISGVRVEDTFFWQTSSLAKGSHTVVVKVTDAAGLSSTATASVKK
ncbi:MAG: S8 family serine peptidase [Phycisphaerales bacterium]|nr:S8 family serine peptidase [Phycisphaerales bacterium]